MVMAVLGVGLTLLLDAPRVLHGVGWSAACLLHPTGIDGRRTGRTVGCGYPRPTVSAVRWAGGGAALPTNQGPGLASKMAAALPEEWTLAIPFLDPVDILERGLRKG